MGDMVSLSGSAFSGYHTKCCTKMPTVHHNTVVVQFCVLKQAFIVRRTSYKLHILELRVSKKFNCDCSGMDDTHFNRQLNYTINLNLELLFVCWCTTLDRWRTDPHTPPAILYIRESDGAEKLRQQILTGIMNIC